jgi:hypothetical protein
MMEGLNQKIDGKWISFHLQSETEKTQKYDVLTKEYHPNKKLGEIKWFGRWRTYAFFPEPDTVFEKQCMKDITNFIEDLILKRKKI